MPRPTRWRCPLLGVCLLILLCVFALLFLGIRRLESADEATRTRGARWLIGPTRAVAAAYLAHKLGSGPRTDREHAALGMAALRRADLLIRAVDSDDPDAVAAAAAGLAYSSGQDADRSLLGAMGHRDTEVAQAVLATLLRLEETASDKVQTRVSKLMQQQARPHLQHATALAKEGKWSEAARERQEALRLLPRDPAAHIALASALLRCNRGKEADEHFLIGWKLRDPKFESRRAEAKALLHANNILRAAELYGEMLKVNPDWAEGHSRLAECYVDLALVAKLRPDAFEVFPGVPTIRPDWRGFVRWAEYHARQAIDIDPRERKRRLMSAW